MTSIRSPLAVPRLDHGVPLLSVDIIRKTVEHSLDEPERVVEFFLFHSFVSPGHDMPGVELDVKLGLLQEVLHHPLVDHIVGPFLLHSFDEEFSAEFGRFEIDIVITEEVGHSVEYIFGSEIQRLQRQRALKNEPREVVIMPVFPVSRRVVIIECCDIQVFTPALHDVVGIAAVTSSQTLEVGEAGAHPLVFLRPEAPTLRGCVFRHSLASLGGKKMNDQDDDARDHQGGTDHQGFHVQALILIYLSERSDIHF